MDRMNAFSGIPGKEEIVERYRQNPDHNGTEREQPCAYALFFQRF